MTPQHETVTRERVSDEQLAEVIADVEALRRFWATDVNRSLDDKVLSALRELQSFRSPPPDQPETGLSDEEREALACANYCLVAASKQQKTGQRAHEIRQYAATLRALAARLNLAARGKP